MYSTVSLRWSKCSHTVVCPPVTFYIVFTVRSPESYAGIGFHVHAARKLEEKQKFQRWNARSQQRCLNACSFLFRSLVS